MATMSGSSTGHLPPLGGRMGSRIRALGLVLLAGVATAACDAGPTGPVPEPSPPLASPSAAGQLAVLAWNAEARELVSRFRTSPPRASRVYALLSVAQHDALLAVGEALGGPLQGQRAMYARVAAAEASARVLGVLYPSESVRLAAAAGRARPHMLLADPGGGPSLEEAAALARQVADAVLDRAVSDGADTPWTGTVPAGPGLWYTSAVPPEPPLDPQWGEVRPWFLSAGSDLRPLPPPAFGSPAFEAALAEVLDFAESRTPEEQRIAEFWADGPGTATPPGRWNAIAEDLIERHNLGEEAAARVLAYMNMALMDAGIAGWDAKYHYWLIRPSQVEPSIDLAVELPNFPAYTSGHSAFSGAASVVLGHFFPGERRALEAMAEEAAISRLYGGIHYRFDSEEGLWQGRAAGGIAVEAAGAPGRTLIAAIVDGTA